jgi:putative NADH-flavin reductase
VKVTIFGATGALGAHCVEQSLEAGHEVTVLARTPAKLSPAVRDRVRVVEGDGLRAEDVAEALAGGTDAILFAIGVDKHSPEDLCTDVTRHIFEDMLRLGIRRFIWCGGGSTLLEDDQVTFGARFVRWFASTFMGLRQRDKLHQLELLERNRTIEWIGVRPLQMRKGPRKGEYRLGFHRFSGFSAISFADCAHAMVGMLTDDTWLHKAPIIQY